MSASSLSRAAIEPEPTFAAASSEIAIGVCEPQVPPQLFGFGAIGIGALATGAARSLPEAVAGGDQSACLGRQDSNLRMSF
jgi:hypothetical protein